MVTRAQMEDAQKQLQQYAASGRQIPPQMLAQYEAMGEQYRSSPEGLRDKELSFQKAAAGRLEGGPKQLLDLQNQEIERRQNIAAGRAKVTS